MRDERELGAGTAGLQEVLMAARISQQTMLHLYK